MGMSCTGAAPRSRSCDSCEHGWGLQLYWTNLFAVLRPPAEILIGFAVRPVLNRRFLMWNDVFVCTSRWKWFHGCIGSISLQTAEYLLNFGQGNSQKRVLGVYGPHINCGFLSMSGFKVNVRYEAQSLNCNFQGPQISKKSIWHVFEVQNLVSIGLKT